ncbi:hypothetical protein IWZ03DRAFT_363895 [Phyllosticta citriasiana]|uniref:Uncharacterized protein n=1 Tax=Phyllosticta citriasiana TaxID=595635 RepID=A0ABR1K7U4_9PEZI
MSKLSTNNGDSLIRRFNTPSYSYSTRSIEPLATSKALREGNNGGIGGKGSYYLSSIGGKEGDSSVGSKDNGGNSSIAYIVVAYHDIVYLRERGEGKPRAYPLVKRLLVGFFKLEYANA